MTEDADRYMMQQLRSLLQPEISVDEWEAVLTPLQLTPDRVEAVKMTLTIEAANWRRAHADLKAGRERNNGNEANRWGVILEHAKAMGSLLKDHDADVLDHPAQGQKLGELRTMMDWLISKAEMIEEAYRAEHDPHQGKGSERHNNRLYLELMKVWIRETKRLPTVTKDSTTTGAFSGRCFQFFRAAIDAAMPALSPIDRPSDSTIRGRIENRSMRDRAWNECAASGYVPEEPPATHNRRYDHSKMT